MNAQQPVADKMRAICLAGYGGPEQLRLEEVPLPPMMPHNEVLIEVHAAGVNPFDKKLRQGWMHQLFPCAPGHILGNDVSGVVVARGFDVSELDIGDRVYGLLDPMRPGAYAEYAVAPAWTVRRMPANLSFEEAATVPMAACTAWYGLVDLAHVGPGMRVLIHAGGGGVGSFAIQIAKHFGAHVVATASPEKAGYVRSLGADEVIDYTATDFVEATRDIDIVLDQIGGETNLKSYEVLKPGGTLLVILRGDEVEMANRERLMEKHHVTTKVVAFSSRPDILDQMRPLFESGALKVPKLTVLPLDQAADAHRQIDTGKTLGKIVLKVRS
ncbi:MAG: NADP-dependent oxidoreductase [Sphingomonadaceae bacterium]|nr:NADP-dependent oxidoreductase [Sphingomonadaceae bacterium]